MIALDATPLVFGPRRGVARALAELLGGLARVERPMPVRLFAPAPLPPDVPPLDGVEVLRAATPRAFRRVLSRALPSMGARVLLSPWSAFPRTRVPVVATVHEVPFVRHGAALEGRWRTLRHRRWLARNARCAAVLVPSAATRDDVLATGRIPAARLRLVPWAFDPAPWAGAGAAASRDGPDVVMVGTGIGRGRKKGLDVLLAALELRADRGWRAVVVGATRRTRLPPSVEVRGGLADDDLRALVASARLLVHPARSEGFGYPPLEAMAAGVPVIAARAGSLPEVVGDAALQVPPGDAAALAAEIGRVLDDPALAADLAARGRARADAFPPERAARAALAALQEAAA